MNRFDYQRPTSLDAARAVLRAHDDARAVAGGQTLLGTMKLGLAAPDALVDLGAIADLSGIEVAADAVTVRAMTRHAAVAADAGVRRAIPALAELAGGIGDKQVRNLGTLGGSLANSDPAACYPAAVLGLGATVHTDERRIDADGFFKGMFETALRPGELITAVRFPVPDAAAYLKFRHPASRFALVGVFLARAGSSVRIGVTGAGPCAFRATAFEQALSARFAVGALDGIELPAAGLNSDLHASGEYRAHLVGVLVRRAVAQLGG